MAASMITDPARSESGHIGRIPVRNIWLLMLYASKLFRQLNQERRVDIEENPNDIPDLVAEILAHLVERRLRRNLSFGYQPKEAVLSRVRGKIGFLKTERFQLLSRGKVACRYEDLTINTPRNRFVRASLDAIARIVGCKQLASRCRALSTSLRRIGVIGEKPNRSEVFADRFGNHYADDQIMVSVAQLAFDLALPTESPGSKLLTLPEREITWVRLLYEKAIAGFYDVVLTPIGWQISPAKPINWQIEEKTSGINKILPSMRTDIVLDHPKSSRRIVIDTKFTSILTKGWYRDETLRSGYVYQIYAYLRSQEGNDPLDLNASGLLLHPSIDKVVDESVVIQGHAIRFATVNLDAAAVEIRKQLLQVLEFSINPQTD